MKKTKIKVTILIFLLIILFGFITISNNLPETIRSKAKFTINFKLNPFDFRIETKNYKLYINKKAIENIKDRIGIVTQKIQQCMGETKNNVKEDVNNLINKSD